MFGFVTIATRSLPREFRSVLERPSWSGISKLFGQIWALKRTKNSKRKHVLRERHAFHFVGLKNYDDVIFAYLYKISCNIATRRFPQGLYSVLRYTPCSAILIFIRRIDRSVRGYLCRVRQSAIFTIRVFIFHSQNQTYDNHLLFVL